MTDLAALIAELGDCPRTEEYARIPYEDGWVGVYCDGTPVRLIPSSLADAALLELAGRCDALSRPEVALRMWKVRAEAAEATVIAKAAQVETLVKERRAERKRAEAAEAELVVSKRLNGKWMDERTEAIIRAEAAEAEVERLRWMLEDLMDWDDIGAQTDRSREEIQDILESRWATREEAGDE